MTHRVLLAEDNFLLREGLLGMLGTVDGVDVVAGCEDLPQTMSAIAQHHPDVVLTDIRMPPGRRDEGIQVADHCRKVHPEIGVILLSQYAEPGYVRALLGQGTGRRGYLLKERVSDLEELVNAIDVVAGGGSVIDPKVVETLIDARTLTGDGELGRLTRRERQVLEGIAQGRTNAAIAANLVLTPHAVEKHINSIFTKLGLSGDRVNHPRVRAALLYLAEGRK